jgi:hypothetical protein
MSSSNLSGVNIESDVSAGPMAMIIDGHEEFTRDSDGNDVNQFW